MISVLPWEPSLFDGFHGVTGNHDIHIGMDEKTGIGVPDHRMTAFVV